MGELELTIREEEILCLLREGYEYKEIAEKLPITHATVKGQMRIILAKLRARNATEAVVIAIRNELISLRKTGI